MKIPITHWGYAELEGVKFFFEPWKEVEEACPFELVISPSLPCPHYNLSEETLRNWDKFVYLDDNTLSAKRCLSLIPEGLTLVNNSYTLVHARYTPGRNALKKLLTLTNALPLFIYGIDESTNINDLLELTKLECPRPIYFSGQSDVPIPYSIKRYKEKQYVKFK